MDVYYTPTTSDKGNLIAACPVRDHHEVMLRILERSHAQPIDHNGQALLDDERYGPLLTEYGQTYLERRRKLGKSCLPAGCCG